MNRAEMQARTEALRQLPIRGIVALAVRACQRMRADFDLPGNAPDRGKHMAAVSEAIQVAVRFVQGEDSFGEEVLTIANAACHAAGEAPENMLGIPATEAGFTAGLVHAALHGNKDLIPPRASHVIPTPPFTGGAEAKADFEKLLALRLGKFPELGPPIDLSEKGPLGPL